MHDTAFALGKAFLEAYVTQDSPIVVEIGSMDINGSLRVACPHNAHYIGLDIEHGEGVDFVIKPNEPLPIRAGYADIVISTSQFEHDPRFWKTFLELCRITREGGLIYINTPSNGNFHSYPIDAWRFYPDAGKTFADWAGENGHRMELIESFTANRVTDQWNDYVCVFSKGPWREGRPQVFLHELCEARNVRKVGVPDVFNVSLETEDQTKIKALAHEVERLRAENDQQAQSILALEARLRSASNVVASATEGLPDPGDMPMPSSHPDGHAGQSELPASFAAKDALPDTLPLEVGHADTMSVEEADVATASGRHDGVVPDAKPVSASVDMGQAPRHSRDD